MNCSQCGTYNPGGSTFCSRCGQLLTGDPAPSGGGYPYASWPAEHIPNYLVQAILVTLCCCVPAGIVSIVFAAQVNGKVAMGDIAGARSDSANAKTWAWISLGLGVAVPVILGVLGLFGAI